MDKIRFQFPGKIRRSFNAVGLAGNGVHVEGKLSAGKSGLAEDGSVAGLQAGQAITAPPVHGGDIAALDDHPGIRLNQHQFKIVVHVGQEIGVQAAIAVEARDPVPGHTVHAGKLSPDEDPAGGVIRHATHVIVGTGHAVLKGGVQSAVGVQPGNPVAAHAIDQGEAAANEDFPVRLQGKGVHIAVHGHSEAGVEGAVGVQARNVRTGQAVHGAEGAANQHLAIRLHDQGVGRDVNRGIVAGVEGAIAVESGDVGMGRAVGGFKRAADDNL